MSDNNPVNHHYVPQFLLRNFSDDKQMIYMFRLNEQQVVKRNIKYNYSKDNLYKDISEEDIMIVEKLFSSLEQKVALVVRKVLESRNQVVLDRTEMEMVKRFLYLMEFRSKRRKSQYEEHNFDPITKATLDMKIEEEKYVSLWLNELKTLLTHTQYDIDLEDLSLPIRLEFDFYMNNTFTTIWDACQDEHFLITDNFGTYERSRKNSPLKLFILFPISPRRMIVLSNSLFRNPNAWSQLDSEFSSDIVHPPKNSYESIYLKSSEDKYIYPVHRVKNRDVIHANEILINEAYELFSFDSPDSIRRSVEKYQSRPEWYVKRDISGFNLENF